MITRLFLIIIFVKASFVFAQTMSPCFQCEPLAEVSITNQGLSRLLEASLKQNFQDLNKIIRSRAGFRDLVLDRSQCKTQTLSEVWSKTKSKEKLDCLGMPDLVNDEYVSGKTKLRPFVARISEFQLNQLDLDLVTPINCQNLRCDIKVKLKKIDVSGKLDVKYSDNSETFIPKSKLKLTNTDRSDVVLTAQGFINPITGQLDDLVFITKDETNIEAKPGSFNLDLDFKQKYDSKEKEIELKSKYFKKQMTPVLEKVQSQKYFQEQVDKYVDSKVFREWALATDKSETRESIQKRVEAKLFADYGSKENLIEKLNQMQLPDFSDSEKSYAFMNQPPKEINFVPDMQDRLTAARIGATAENAGFSNEQGFQFALLAVYSANQIQDSSILTNDLIEPFLKKEIVPIVEAQVNHEMANLKNYWNQVSKIPSLNLQDLATSQTLREKIGKEKDPDEKIKLMNEMYKLNQKMHDDWLPIDTQVFIDQNTRQQKILKAQITQNLPECSTQPRKFSEDSDENFDLRTELGPKALQEYFNKMAENKKLDFCVGSLKPATCDGGAMVRLKQPPKISCEQGKLVVDLDGEARHAIFGVGLAGQIKGEIKNCSGDPCIQFTDSSGKIKNAFLNTFFGATLNRAISGALSNGSNQPTAIPNLKLKDVSLNPQNCNSKLDWDIKP